MSNRLSTVEGLELQPGAEAKKIEQPSYTSEERVNNVTVIQIDIGDPFVTKTGKGDNFGDKLYLPKLHCYLL